jgi:hypothetical protein
VSERRFQIRRRLVESLAARLDESGRLSARELAEAIQEAGTDVDVVFIDAEALATQEREEPTVPTMQRFAYESADEREQIRETYRRAYGAELVDVPDDEDAIYAQYLRQTGEDPAQDLSLRNARGLLMTSDEHGRHMAAAERLEERVFAAEREVEDAKARAAAKEDAMYEAHSRAMGWDDLG